MSLVSTVWLVASVLALSQPSLQSSPSIELTLEAGPVSVGGLAVLICNISGVSEVHNFTWYHNGGIRMERPEPYIDIQRNGNVGKLSIHDIAVEEAGNYTCIAHTSNITTPLQTSYILSLEVPPVVTAEPQQYVLLGNNATLRCNVTGNPVPVVLWRRNGTLINFNENTRYSRPMLGLLKFTNATTKDAGVYACVASSTKGSDMTNITLTVLSVPEIQLQPTTVTEAGRQTILHCNATGIDTPTVSWRSGGIVVGTSNDSRLISYLNGSLVITDTKVLDTGNYSCIAENKAGSVNSTITLNVTGSPVLLVPPENTIVRVGSNANLSCSYLANPNDGTIHWQRGDINLPSTSSKYIIIADGTLIIRETTDDDSGEYQCTVTNSKGNITAKANLTVINQPNTPDNFQQVGSADTQTFTVSWNAPEQSDTTRPVSSYLIVLRLVSDGQQAESTIRVPSNQTQYTFTELLPGNRYEVLIAAHNQVDTSSYSDPLIITTNFTVPALEYFIVTKSGTDEAQLIFTWRIKYNGGHAINNFAIQYQHILVDSEEDTWTDLFTRGGLDESTETYKPESLPPSGSYIFRAVIGNMLGNNFHNYSTEINITDAVPGQPSKPEASEITTDSVTLEFDLQFMGTGIVKQFVLKVTGDSDETQTVLADDRINSSSNVTVTVVGLAADSTYRFQVAAMNDIDIGPYSEMSDEITTDKDDTFVYIIVGAVGGFVVIVIILLTTLFVCYMCNRRMKAHKHQISINGIPEKTKVKVIQDSDATDDSNGFIQHFDKPLPKFTPYNSNSTILSPIERSQSLQYRNDNFGPAGSTISYGSSVATRTASLLQHTKPNNYLIRRDYPQMYNSATLINYGSGSQFNTMESRRWSPPSDLSQRERRSPSSTYHSESMGRITNMATDV